MFMTEPKKASYRTNAQVLTGRRTKIIVANCVGKLGH